MEKNHLLYVLKDIYNKQMQKINSFSNCPIYNYETQANIKSVCLKKNTPQLF